MELEIFSQQQNSRAELLLERMPLQDFSLDLLSRAADFFLSLRILCPRSFLFAFSDFKLKYVDNSRVCEDYQELRIQEQVQRLTIGSIPRSIKVVVKVCRLFALDTMTWSTQIDKFNA